jgi:hypothetical protein
MQSILDKYSVGEKPSFQESEDEGLMTIQYCRAHPSHRAFLAELATLKSVTNITYDERSSPHRR